MPGEDLYAGLWVGAGYGAACECRFLLEGVAEAFPMRSMTQGCLGETLDPLGSDDVGHGDPTN